MKDFDKLIAVAQDIRNEAAKEYEEEIKELKTEISALENFKNEKIKYEKEIKELKKSNDTLKEKYSTMRLKELLGDFVIKAFRVKKIYTPKPKCNMCDSNRQIHFKSPLGTEFVENCTCSKSTILYEVYEVNLLDFAVYKNNNREFEGYYELDETNTSYDHYDRCGSIIRDKTAFPNYYDFQAVFFDKKLCQAYCDMLSKKEDNNDRQTTKII